MNINELTKAIADYALLPRIIVRQVLDAQGEVIANHLASADANVEAEATLPGLGKLKTTTRTARVGRNPRTGEPVQIPERVAVRFSAGKALNATLNP
ncbi:MAG: HU family DNA-binding protein [Rhodocyclaceae bacterium]